MACELIRVDFKRGTVKERGPLTGRGYDPETCPHLADMILGLKVGAKQAHEDGIDPQRIMVVFVDPLAAQSYTIYDRNVLTTKDVLHNFNYMADQFYVEYQNEQLEFDPLV